jgi:hypothetical protein
LGYVAIILGLGWDYIGITPGSLWCHLGLHWANGSTSVYLVGD